VSGTLTGAEGVRSAAFQGFALSPPQRRLWALREAGGLGVRGSIRITGDLDPARLRAAVDAVVARQEILRTVFRCLPGMSTPLQVIEEPEVRGPIWDESAADLETFGEKRGEIPLRLALVRRGAGDHLLFVALHPLCGDAGTLAVLTAEIARSYSRAAPGDEPMQYADFAAWQNEIRESAEAQADAEHWSRQGDLAELLSLSLPFERRGEAPFLPDRVHVEVAVAAATEPWLLACWQAYLSRLTGHSRLAVAVQSAGRDFDELAGACGPFARSLPVIAEVDDGRRVDDLARTAAHALAIAREKQDGFSWPDAAFPAWGFELEERPEPVAAGVLVFALEDWIAVGERSTLTLICRQGAGRLGLELRFDAARIDREEADRLLAGLVALIRGAMATPDAPFGEIESLSEAERGRVLAAPDRVHFADGCLHELVAAQAARTPGAVAIRSEGGELTFAELERRADLLARQLAARGIGRESLVAVFIERSPEMVIALLGILKAGGAWVPLDPDHPAGRLAAILEDAVPALVVTRSGLAERLPESLPRLLVDTPEAREDQPSIELPEPDPDRLAYVIHTSGSTGRPKGVMVTHRAIRNRLLWILDAFSMGPGDRLLQKTPYGFDASIWEIFCPLIAGAELVLARPGGHQDTGYLAETTARERITVLQLVPSLLGPFLDEPAAAEIRALRRMFCGGEELPAALVRRFFDRFTASETSLCNLYGPTEAAIDVAFRPCEPGMERVPIGRALPNVRLSIANRHLRPVPLGAPGELLIGGVNLARGYLGRPEWTAERFIPDPWSDEPGARLYRTGDLVRRLLDGEIEYLGRVDRQVKVRGVRIELREIEELLAACPKVRQAVVIVRGEGETRRLLAYAVPAEESLTPTELREHLAGRLPAAMVPGAFVVLRTLPLTPNGKLDWNALPEPESASPSAAPEDEPRTPTEQILAGIWADVLGREQVGGGDDFFALGGHSLAATQVISRIRKAFSVDLRVQTLFDAPTVAGLARELDRAQRAGEGLEAPPIEPVPRDGALPLSFAQQRLWFLEKLKPGTALYNIPEAVRLRGALDVPALAAALAAIVRRHESLRTTFRSVRGEAVQVVGPATPPDLPLIDLSALPAERRRDEAGGRIQEAADRPFDLERGPLLRALLVRLGEDDHLAGFTVHHIVGDAWSTGVLIRELAALYNSAPLPELPVQYADFAAWQRRWLRGEVLERQLDWWRRRLAGAPPRLDLPADRPRPETPSFRGETRPVQLPADLTRALEALGRRQGATLFMTLLAAFQLLLRRWTGRNDVVVGTDVANRNRGETEGLIGFFINQLALRTDLSGDPTFAGLLARVREGTLGAYAHQDVPFDLVVDTLEVERRLDVAPLFQVKLFLENTPSGALALPGLTVSRLDVDIRVAKLDLVLALWETPEGLSGWINYSTDLFDRPRIERLVRHYTTLLAAVAAWPDAKLSELDHILSEIETKERAMEKNELKGSLSFKKFKAAAPKPVTVEEADIVERGELTPGQKLPLVLTPRVPDVDLAEWATTHRERLEADLLEHGAILFRGFGIADPDSFERFARTLCPDLYNENGEHPRESVSGSVYTPVFYPQDQKLLWHNENSFNWKWPRKIFFCCAKPADQGGETPIADSRRVYAEMPEDVRALFEERGVMYQRNYAEGLGLPWQTVFQTDSREEVEREGEEEHFVAHWRDGDRLRTRAVRPGVVRDPASGGVSWFNQAQHFHDSCLDPETRRSIRALFPEDELPRQCYYGDGSTIEDGQMQTVLDVYEKVQVAFPWQRGDVLLVDNLLTAHGRNPFKGERKILVAMGEMSDYGKI
jgi:amino acid adenylation domain-containing protein